MVKDTTNKINKSRAIRRLVIWYKRNSAVTSLVDTAANSANLVSLINETEDSFSKILDMQLPEIIPFENTELEMKFQEISGQIISEIQ